MPNNPEHRQDEPDNKAISIEDLHLRELTKKLSEVKRIVPDEERMLHKSRLDSADVQALINRELEPLSILVFGTSEIIRDNPKAGAYIKLTIDKGILETSQELRARFVHVEAPKIEFDIWMLKKLTPETRQRVMMAIADWEQKTGLNVRFEGVIGRRS